MQKSNSYAEKHVQCVKDVVIEIGTTTGNRYSIISKTSQNSCSHEWF